ncbi:hypothetical protein SEMRO_1864_G302410.1 [Seminavis robusta]|uniref:Uncharacterized protein n=1 Tax=Seminavis robusta TaxID=568900 RepID=A0A9N8EVA0_9STRA|nr:hypothetical protein SEMRO_1864_G302410.1 [Seminavis robusta]|eukprot:Sro1864_g302410.1 n/a (98) ;mRNA; f:16485-16879
MSDAKSIKIAMFLAGAKSIKIEEDDAIIFTMEEGPPVQLKFACRAVCPQEGRVKVEAYDQDLIQETAYLDIDSLCLDCEEKPEKSGAEMFAAFDFDE